MRAGLAVLLVLLSSVAVARTAAAQPLVTAVFDPSGAVVSGSRCRDFTATGATVARITLSWRAVAPDSPTDGFQPRDPADPQYRWTEVDAEITSVVACGLKPIVDIVDAPRWALLKGTEDPGTPEASALG